MLGFLDDDTVWPALMVRWELALLATLGFGLDLGQCAATGANDQLVYVSPRTGRAVSASAGEPYKERLLRLPAFLTGRVPAVGREDLVAGVAPPRKPRTPPPMGRGASPPVLPVSIATITARPRPSSSPSRTA